MAYVLDGERVPVTVDDLTIEVRTIGAWAVAQAAASLAAAYDRAKPGQPEADALNALYAFFVAEAQPTWAIVDHRGPVLPTAAGMLRLPVPMAFALIAEWIGTATPKESAVDKIIPVGELRDALNAKLRAKRRAA